MDSPLSYSDVAAIVRDNAALDAELTALADAATPDLLHASQGSVRWTLAEQLGHLGEFPRFVAADSRRGWRAAARSGAPTTTRPGWPPSRLRRPSRSAS